jgi:YtkA-like
VRRCRLIWVVVALVIGIGCHRTPNTSSAVIVEFQIKPMPVQVGPVVVSLTLTDAANHPVNGAQITVEADMSHAGMNPVFAQAAEVQPARYESHVSLGMAGDWVILLHGKLPNGEKLERQFDVRDVRPTMSGKTR